MQFARSNNLTMIAEELTKVLIVDYSDTMINQLHKLCVNFFLLLDWSTPFQ